MPPKKCLFIKDRLLTGGTTSSFLNLLTSLQGNDDFSFSVWINGITERDINLIPKGIEIIKNERLEAAFRTAKTKKERLFQLFREHTFLETIYGRIVRSECSKAIPSIQRQAIAHVKTLADIDLTEFDAVITWEEMFPCYLLADKIKAKKKIAWIHPDYSQGGFDSRLDAPHFRKLDAIVAVSEANAQSMRNKLPELQNAIWGIRNSLDVRKLKAMATERPSDMPESDNPVFVTVARIQNISKAVDRAIRIAARLKKEKLHFTWYFIGNGEDFAEMADLARNSGVSEEVRFLGEKPNPYGYIQHADLLILQSYYEGCPMVVDESLALGTPVLVSNYAAAREQVKDGCGVICDNNEEAIFSAIRTILQSPEQLQDLKKQIRNIDVGDFNNAQSFLDFLNRI